VTQARPCLGMAFAMEQAGGEDIPGWMGPGAPSATAQAGLGLLHGRTVPRDNAGRHRSAPAARPGTPSQGRRACRRPGRSAGSWPRPPSGQKGRRASRIATFSSSSSRSISACPRRPVSFPVSSASPLSDLLTSTASPAARNASRRWLSVAAVTPRLRKTGSRSLPRSSCSTTAIFRGRDIRPPRPSAAQPDAWGRRSAALGRSTVVVIPSAISHLQCGPAPLVRCLSRPCDGEGATSGLRSPPSLSLIYIND